MIRETLDSHMTPGCLDTVNIPVMSKEEENEESATFCKEKLQSDSFNSETGVKEEEIECILKGPPDKSMSFTTRIQSDSIYKEKAILSLCLCWAFVTLGWASGQFGPAFLDLQIITRTNVKKASGFLTSRAVGYLAGGILTGLLFDRISKLLIVALFQFAGVVISAVLPWCFWFEMMIAVQFWAGCYCGGIGASGNALLMYIWGREGRSYVQALHFAFAIGGITSPLVTSPFLQETHEDTNDIGITVTGNVSSDIYSDCSSNMSQRTHNTCINSNTFSNETTASGYDIGDSRLYVAYCVTAAMHISCVVPLFILYVRAKRQKNTSTQKITQDIQRISREITFGFKILVLLSLSFFVAIYCAMEDTFTAYLTAFCVTQLTWSKVQGSYVTSLYWAVFGFARFLGIWVIQFISPTTIICGLTIFLCVGLGALSVSASLMVNEGIWVCTVCTGASMSLIYPCVIIWTEEKLLPVSGKIVALFMIAASSGTMTNPIILGYLMETFTPMWFTYLLFGESVVLMILFLVLLLIARVSETKFGTGNSHDSVTVNIGLTSKEHV
ncbi:sodium-dependent glucose transporter 1A-like isoform X2 [Mizuhopecten yessoensis]|uniref:Sodium-dependent glucose transporter 1 n=1 Tax=Mizuhopecten yessoensis TaxID=6573 RepID=A0A210QG37_MIZYE|nr:sodium-dependent glucose transporter 1A-like isoform X2 [Mizuhopecten yessoensis]OWF47705.1 Sodium-dependent glucose transporter 1 [Mizuhopecten yessoensis]